MTWTPFTRRRLLQGSAAIAATSILPARPAFAFSGLTPTNLPAPTYPGKSIANANITLVNNPIAGTNTGDGFAGLSLEKASMLTPLFGFGSPNKPNQTLISLLNILAPSGSVLRLGGSSTDTTVWNGKFSSNTITQNAINTLAAFMQQLPNWKLLYAVNMGGYGPNAVNTNTASNVTTLTDASAEVNAIYAAVGGQMFGIEIGNEPDGFIRGSGPWSPLNITSYSVNSGQSTMTFKCANSILSSLANLPQGAITLAGFTDTSMNSSITSPTQTWTVQSANSTEFVAAWSRTPSTTSGGTGTAAPTWLAAGTTGSDQYQQIWSAFYNNMTKDFIPPPNTTTPLLVTGPATECYGTGANGDVQTWTVNDANWAKNHSPNTIPLAPVTQHWYDTNSGSYKGDPEYSYLLTNPYAIGDGNDMSTLWTTVKNNGQSYRISECNSCSDGGYAGVSDSYAASLWAIDFALKTAMIGNTGCNFHGNGGAYDSTAGNGFNVYSPFNNDSDGVLTNIQPIFYGMALVNMAGGGAMMGTPTITYPQGQTNLNINAYAINKTAGGVDLFIVNKDPDYSLNLTITTWGPDIASAYLYQLTQGPTPSQQNPAFSVEPSLTATNGTPNSSSCDVTLQGSAISYSTGTWVNGTSFANLDCVNTQTECYVPLRGAVLIKITFTS